MTAKPNPVKKNFSDKLSRVGPLGVQNQRILHQRVHQPRNASSKRGNQGNNRQRYDRIHAKGERTNTWGMQREGTECLSIHIKYYRNNRRRPYRDKE